MNGPILVGYDGSEASKLALAFAAERAKALGRKLVLVNVVPANVRNLAFSEFLLPGVEFSKVFNVDKVQESAWKRLEQVAAELRTQGVEAQPVVKAGDAADELIAAAKETSAEQVVLGYMSYEHKLPYGVGSVAEKVLRYCDRTVTIVRPSGQPGPKGKR